MALMIAVGLLMNVSLLAHSEPSVLFLVCKIPSDQSNTITYIQSGMKTQFDRLSWQPGYISMHVIFVTPKSRQTTYSNVLLIKSGWLITELLTVTVTLFVCQHHIYIISLWCVGTVLDNSVGCEVMIFSRQNPTIHKTYLKVNNLYKLLPTSALETH